MKLEINKLMIAAGNSLRRDSGPGEAVDKIAFDNLLKGMLGGVNASIHASEDAATVLAKGGGIELHQVMLAAEQANLSLQLTLQIRNKVLEAYQEVMRMQV